MKNYKIAVAGTGYVGLSLGVLLSQHHQVVAVDIVQATLSMNYGCGWMKNLIATRWMCPKKAQHRKEVIIRSKFARPPVRADPVAGNSPD